MHRITLAFLDRLAGVKPVKGGQSYKALCPAHADHHASLSISEGHSGILLRCRSHDCSFEAIARAVGVDPKELFWDQREFGLTLPAVSLPAMPRTNPQPAPEPEDKREVRLHVADHVYTDATGSPTIRVRRYHINNKERIKGYKKSCIVQRFENGQWLDELRPETKRTIYNLKNILQNPGDRIAWVEGENKVDRLTIEGILATTALGGTGGKHNLPDLSALKGREVAILPDQDEPGREYAATLQKELTRAGAVAWIATAYPEIAGVVPFPGYDVADYLDSGGTAELLREALNPPPPPPLKFPLLTVHELLALPPPVWQVPDYIQEGSLFLIYGPPSTGKTFIAMDLAINISQRSGISIWCDREIRKTGPVVYINGDGGRGFRDRVAAWYEANDAKPEDYEFYILNTDLPISDTRSVEEFYRSLDALPQPPAALFVDTYSRCIAGADENDSGAASLTVRNLDCLRDRYGCSIGLLHHTGIEGYRPRGSTVLLGAADSSFRVSKDSETISFNCMKQRNGADRVQGQTFFLQPTRTVGQVCIWRTGQVDKMTQAARAELQVAAYISDFPDCIASEIAAHTQISIQRVNDALNSLVKQRLIIRGLPREASGKGRNPTTFRVAPPHEP